MGIGKGYCAFGKGLVIVVFVDIARTSTEVIVSGSIVRHLYDLDFGGLGIAVLDVERNVLVGVSDLVGRNVYRRESQSRKQVRAIAYVLAVPVFLDGRAEQIHSFNTVGRRVFRQLFGNLGVDENHCFVALVFLCGIGVEIHYNVVLSALLAGDVFDALEVGESIRAAAWRVLLHNLLHEVEARHLGILVAVGNFHLGEIVGRAEETVVEVGTCVTIELCELFGNAVCEFVV